MSEYHHDLLHDLRVLAADLKDPWDAGLIEGAMEVIVTLRQRVAELEAKIESDWQARRYERD